MSLPPPLPKQSAREFYLDDNGQPAGPFGVEQIQEFIQQGRASLDHLASTTGQAPWQTLRDYPEFATASVRALPGLEWFSTTRDTALTQGIDWLTGLLASPLGRGPGVAGMYEEYQNVLGYLGAYGLIICGLLAVLASLILTIKTDSGGFILGGLVFFLLMLFGHYLAVKFNRANRTLLRAGLLQLGSDAVPATGAVVNLLLSFIVLLSGLGGFAILVSSSFFEAASGLIFSFLLAIGFYHLAFLCQNCSLVLQTNTETQPMSGGEVYLALLKFSIRLALALSLVAFGFGVVFGFLLLALGSLEILLLPVNASGAPATNFSDPFSSLNALSQTSLGLSISLITFLAFLPLITYYLYLFITFAIDLCVAIFRTANNTDRIK